MIPPGWTTHPLTWTDEEPDFLQVEEHLRTGKSAAVSVDEDGAVLDRPTEDRSWLNPAETLRSDDELSGLSGIGTVRGLRLEPVPQRQLNWPSGLQ